MVERVLDIQIRIAAFPGGARADFTREVGARRAARTTQAHPLWLAVRGRGYAIWLSDVTPKNMAATPPLWAIRVETRSTLNAEGQQAWSSLVAALEAWCRRLGLDYTITPH